MAEEKEKEMNEETAGNDAQKPVEEKPKEEAAAREEIKPQEEKKEEVKPEAPAEKPEEKEAAKKEPEKEAPAEEKPKAEAKAAPTKKKINRMTLAEIETKLKETREKMGPSDDSRYVQHLLRRKEQLTRPSPEKEEL